MINISLEKFDSPTVIINQVYENEDWGVMAFYVSKQDVMEAEGEAGFAEIGWHVSVSLPNLNDADFDQIFSTPEAALEFGIDQIISGNLTPAATPTNEPIDENHPFPLYNSIA